jgi:hypothetical protein
MNKQNLLFGLIGLVLGAAIVLFLKFNQTKKDSSYFKLMEDVDIGELGNLKKGVVLKYDDSYPEGFTRFILYINAKGIKFEEDKEIDNNDIVPYWIEKKESN